MLIPALIIVVLVAVSLGWFVNARNQGRRRRENAEQRRQRHIAEREMWERMIAENRAGERTPDTPTF